MSARAGRTTDPLQVGRNVPDSSSSTRLVPTVNLRWTFAHPRLVTDRRAFYRIDDLGADRYPAPARTSSSSLAVSESAVSWVPLGPVAKAVSAMHPGPTDAEQGERALQVGLPLSASGVMCDS